VSTVQNRTSLVFLPLAAAFVVVPLVSRAEEDHEGGAGDFVAEALFLADTLPPGSQDLNVAVAVEQDEADPATGERNFSAAPVVQFAVPLGERAGFTVDLGIPTGGPIESPGASFKVLLREAAPARTGLSASFDVHGLLARQVDTEVAVGLGALRPIGPISVRATALGATGVSGWAPRLQAGVSAAVALSPRWIALAEVIADANRDGTAVSAGPTLKVALGESLAVMTGALFELGGPATPVFTFQLSASR
jgi:hypothetical protein